MDFGADFVVESLTKYINGHGDAQGGAIISNDLATMDRIRYEAQVNVGSVISPFNAWQIFRGAVTFPLRMERINLYPEKFRKGFIRFSIGLENPDDIIGDLDQALKSIGL